MGGKNRTGALEGDEGCVTGYFLGDVLEFKVRPLSFLVRPCSTTDDTKAVLSTSTCFSTLRLYLVIPKFRIHTAHGLVACWQVIALRTRVIVTTNVVLTISHLRYFFSSFITIQEEEEKEKLSFLPSRNRFFSEKKNQLFAFSMCHLISFSWAIPLSFGSKQNEQTSYCISTKDICFSASYYICLGKRSSQQQPSIRYTPFPVTIRHNTAFSQPDSFSLS